MGDYEGELELTTGSLNDLRKAVRLLPEAVIGIVLHCATAQCTACPGGAPA